MHVTDIADYHATVHRNVCATDKEREALELAIRALKRWRNGDVGHDSAR